MDTITITLPDPYHHHHRYHLFRTVAHCVRPRGGSEPRRTAARFGTTMRSGRPRPGFYPVGMSDWESILMTAGVLSNYNPIPFRSLPL